MELFFRKYGEGPPLIILHGLYGSSDNWISLAKSLSDNFEVYLPDQRNHGNSPHSTQHDYPSMRDDLSYFMDSQNLDKAVLLGHSMGGKSAMHFAVQQPGRIESMIVIDIAPQAYNSEHSNHYTMHERILESLLGVNFETVQNRKDIEIQLGRSIYSQKVRSFLLKNAERTDSGRYRWRINAEVIRSELPAILGGLKPEDYSGGKGITGFPVLFIRGGKSDYISDEMIPGILSIFPVAEINTIPGAGHWLHVEQSSLLLKTVKYFLLGE
jgi:esterase